MTEKSLVVQHNKLIESRYKLKVTEQRLIKLLVSMIEPDDEDFKQYEIRVSYLANIVGIKSGDIYPAIDRAVETLMDTPIKFNDGDDKVNVRWLSSSRYKTKEGIALLRFDPELKPFLLQLKEQFTSYKLINIIRLKHIYSIRIYELLKQYERIGKRRFNIEDLRKILMIDDGEYKQYRDFRRWVLKVSQKELEEKTDISFEWNEEKTKRVCVAIEFIIKSQKRNEKSASEIVEIIPKENDSKKPIDNLLNHVVEGLLAIGVTRITAEKLAKEYDEERIQSAIAYTHAQHRDGRLNNPAGFVVEAVKNGYRDNQAEERKRKEESAKVEANKKARRKEWEGMKTRWNAWRVERVDAYAASLDAETLGREKASFRESLKGSVMAKSVCSNPESEARHFRIYLAGKMSGLGILEWAQATGVDMSPFVEFARLDGKL